MVKNLNEINLLSAVLEVARDPEKYNAYLGDLRKEVANYEEVLAKYTAFQDAQSYIATKEALIDAKMEELNKTEKALKQAQDNFQQAKQASEAELEKSFTDLRKQQKQYTDAIQVFEKAKEDFKVAQANHEKYVETVTRWQNQLQEKQAILDKRYKALKDLMER